MSVVDGALIEGPVAGGDRRWHRPVFLGKALPRDAPMLAGDTGEDRVPGAGVHHAFAGLHGAGNGREPRLDLADELARPDPPRIVADEARVSGLSARAVEWHRGFGAHPELPSAPVATPPLSPH